jgi:hypothetical protein
LRSGFGSKFGSPSLQLLLYSRWALFQDLIADAKAIWFTLNHLECQLSAYMRYSFEATMTAFLKTEYKAEQVRHPAGLEH